MHVWRLSGVDASWHAFPAEGGYVRPCDRESQVPLGSGEEDGQEWFGPYEVLTSVCGVETPVAMVLAAIGTPCRDCTQRVRASTRRVRPWLERCTAAVPG
ncbi:hypothetical protein [Parasphingorhabdus pacifica]